MLSADQYVHVFSFDFTKAFDAVRHETLMNKMAQLNIPDNIYNWIKAAFEQHFHCTRYSGECSMVAAVKASVIKGLDWAQHRSSSPQPTCTRLRQRIAFSNLQTTRTLWYRRQTQVLDWVKYPM